MGGHGHRAGFTFHLPPPELWMLGQIAYRIDRAESDSRSAQPLLEHFAGHCREALLHGPIDVGPARHSFAVVGEIRMIGQLGPLHHIDDQCSPFTFVLYRNHDGRTVG